MSEGCVCQKCGCHYKVDVLVSDNIWEIIRPTNKTESSGLLCGVCILKKIESWNKFGAYKLVDT